MSDFITEIIVGRFESRCPYCESPIDYTQFDLKEGENSVRCSSCGKTYIKVVMSDPRMSETECDEK